MAMAGGAMLVLAASRPAPADPVLYLFFAPDTPDLALFLQEARRHADIPVRPVLLPDRLTGSDFPEELLRAVEALGQDVIVIDEEGLALAARFGVRSTPCAVRTGRRTHKAVGTRIDWKELMTCG